MKLLDDLFMDKPAGMGMPETGRPQPKEKKTYAPEALGGLVGGPVGAVAAGQIKKIFKPKTDEQIEQEALTELMDPEHEAELVKIKTSARTTRRSWSTRTTRSYSSHPARPGSRRSCVGCSGASCSSRTPLSRTRPGSSLTLRRS
jgi:hypothetical protein